MKSSGLVLAALLTTCAVACGDAPALGPSASALVSATPRLIDFGDVPVDTTSAAATIVVGPQGLEPSTDEIMAVREECLDFAIDRAALTVPATVARTCPRSCWNTTQTLAATFTPSAPGVQSCQVAVDLASGETRTFTLLGAGTRPALRLTVTPALTSDGLDFGEIWVGRTSPPIPFALRNDGSQLLELSTVSLPGAPFVVQAPMRNTIPPGETVTWRVACLPTAGLFVRLLSLTYADGPPAQVFSSTVRCRGHEARVEIDASPMVLRPTFPGGADIQSFLVRATDAGVQSNLLELTVTPSSHFTIEELPALPRAVTVAGISGRVRFTPQAGDRAAVVGQLVAKFDNLPTLTANLWAPVVTAQVSLEPGGDVDLGIVCGGTSATRQVKLTNVGSGDVTLTQPRITGAGFEVGGVTPGTVLAAAQRSAYLLDLTATPAAGEQQGTLTIESDRAGFAPVTRQLRAVGLPSGVGADPAAVTFDGLAVGVTSAPRDVRVTNCNAQPIGVAEAGLAITGPDADAFTIVASDLEPGDKLQPGATAVVQVGLRPTTAGRKNADLVIPYGAGESLVVPLAGAGDQLDGPDVDDGPGRGSYYACAVGGGASPLWALALLPLLRRRRRARETHATVA